MRIDEIQNLSKTLIPPLSSVFMRYPYKARVYNSAALSINNNTVTVLTFNTERYDTGAFHSTSVNTGRLTVPVIGYYLIGGNIQYDTAAAAVRDIRIIYNNTTTIAWQREIATGAVILSVASLWYCATAGDYFELLAFQLSGGAVDVQYTAGYSPEFWIAGPI